MPEIKITCPRCGAAYWVGDAHVGETAECEDCGAGIPIAAEATGSAAAAVRFDGQASPVFIPALGLRFIRVDPGEFVMGCNHGYSAEAPVHAVRVQQPYWLGECPVTQAVYEDVMDCNPSRFQGPTCPVESVSWHQAQEFCHRLTNRERDIGVVPDGASFRLPTEAEWEFACVTGPDGRDVAVEHRDPDRREPPGPDGERIAWLDACAWYEGNSAGRPHPVGLKAANARGFFDMLGNVGEWCADWYAEYASQPVDDPFGPPFGELKVRRGGSWASIARRCRASDRVGVRADARCAQIGFRVAFSRG